MEAGVLGCRASGVLSGSQKRGSVRLPVRENTVFSINALDIITVFGIMDQSNLIGPHHDSLSQVFPYSFGIAFLIFIRVN
jgi:hypothetical protein